MCGICGIIDFKNVLSKEHRQTQVALMNKALTHRGPDDAGDYSNQNTSLAMRRLSIIDLNQGQQPQYNADGDILVFQNGEIYNYKELKADLIQKGFHFKTNSDTEVLAHLYEAEGSNMFSMLKGMFAICIYDAQNNTYLIARDRFGEKPLYYHWDQAVFSFSSEIKSLLENTFIERKLNHEALPYYFRTSLVPEPITLLDNINSLEPGHFIKLQERGFNKAAYFTANYTASPAITSEAEAIEYIRPILTKAIQRQTISDVSIGAFLSGGIDSSTIVALLQQNSTQQIKTFNVRFENQAFDESAIAKKVAQHCGTDHHEIFVPDFDFDESIFWMIIEQVGLPFRDSSAIPSFLVSKEISKHLKVALSGDGGDELFGGYNLFRWYQKIIQLKKIPASIRTVMGNSLAFAQSIPSAHQFSFLRQFKRGLDTTMEALEDIPIALNELFSRDQIADLLGKKTTDYTGLASFPLLKKYPNNSDQWSPLRRIMYYRLKHTLPSNMLIKVDRMSMANSLEVRAPFLDPDLFDATTALSDDLLIKNKKGKHILRQIMANDLPEEVFNHPKTGFNMPLFKYMNDGFKALAQDLLFDNNPWSGFIPTTELKKIYDRGISAKKDTSAISVFQASHQLWMIMMLLGWARRFKITV